MGMIMRYRVLSLTSILLLVISGVLVFAQPTPITIKVLQSGDAIILESVDVTNAPTVLNITALGTPYLCEAYTANGDALPVNYSGNSISVYVFDNTTVFIRYIVPIAVRDGRIWSINLSVMSPVRIELPPNAVPIYISRVPDNVETVNDSLILDYSSPGQVSIEYVISYELPPVTTTPNPQTTSQKETESGVMPPPYSQRNKATISYVVLVAVAVGVVGVLAYYLRSRSNKLDTSGLDDRDKAILEAIRKLGGVATASQIMSETGIPKTPLYRRINKLVKMGFIEEVGDKNKRFILKK
jgi:uncharacterized membrane protein